MFKTPILFLIFNRPDETFLAFEQIKKQKPKYLFVSADGPRKDNASDIENCRITRKIILDNVDWDCELKTLYRDSNLGCGHSVSGAINWFFDHVDQGIIIEDDILADPSFFTFCDILLKKYEHDERIMHISGLNVQTEYDPMRATYFFARFGSIWGWATWKRAWRYYDFDISQWNVSQYKKILLDTLPTEFQEARETLFDNQYEHKVDAWGYQWSFARLLNSGLSIVPNSNLIHNIGCKEGGAHLSQYHPWSDLKIKSLPDQWIHPNNIIVDSEYDKLFLGFTHGPVTIIKRTNIFKKNFRRVKKVLKRIYSKIKR